MHELQVFLADVHRLLREAGQAKARDLRLATDVPGAMATRRWLGFAPGFFVANPLGVSLVMHGNN